MGSGLADAGPIARALWQFRLGRGSGIAGAWRLWAPRASPAGAGLLVRSSAGQGPAPQPSLPRRGKRCLKPQRISQGIVPQASLQVSGLMPGSLSSSPPSRVTVAAANPKSDQATRIHRRCSFIPPCLDQAAIGTREDQGQAPGIVRGLGSPSPSVVHSPGVEILWAGPD